MKDITEQLQTALAALVRLHDNQVFICGSDDKRKVNAALNRARTALLESSPDDFNAEFAEVIWTPQDIYKLRPKWTLEQCREFLEENEGTIQDRSIERGWEVIEQLLN